MKKIGRVLIVFFGIILLVGVFVALASGVAWLEAHQPVICDVSLAVILFLAVLGVSIIIANAIWE